MLYGRKQPLEIGSLQQVLWLLFQVGGEFSRMDDCQRDFTLPSCALTHTVPPLPPVHSDLFLLLYVPAAQMQAQQQTTKEATVQLNIM